MSILLILIEITLHHAHHTLSENLSNRDNSIVPPFPLCGRACSPRRVGDHVQVSQPPAFSPLPPQNRTEMPPPHLPVECQNHPPAGLVPRRQIVVQVLQVLHCRRQLLLAPPQVQGLSRAFQANLQHHVCPQDPKYDAVAWAFIFESCCARVVTLARSHIEVVTVLGALWSRA